MCRSKQPTPSAEFGTWGGTSTISSSWSFTQRKQLLLLSGRRGNLAYLEGLSHRQSVCFAPNQWTSRSVAFFIMSSQCSVSAFNPACFVFCLRPISTPILSPITPIFLVRLWFGCLVLSSPNEPDLQSKRIVVRLKRTNRGRCYCKDISHTHTHTSQLSRCKIL